MSDAIVLPRHPLFKNLTGKRQGRLVVISYAGRVGPNRISSWLCKCDCGKEKTITATRLNSGTQSCGCLQRETIGNAARTHGRSKTPEYKVWAGMIGRCSDQNDENYGGRGIRVCDRWLKFENFFSDMGPRPSDRHEIDRRNVNGNYEPSNCRWVVRLVNARNKRTANRITFNGETLCVTEWAEKIGLGRHIIEKRLRVGWSIERTLTTPSRICRS